MDASEIEAQQLHDQRMARINRERAELARLRAIECAARAYFDGYVQDEAEDECYCIDRKQHDAAVALKSALEQSQEPKS